MHFISRTFFIFAFVCLSLVFGVSAVEAETVSVSPSSVASGGNITVIWSASATQSLQDFVSIYLVGAPNSSYNSWSYLPAGTGGTVTLAVMDAAGVPLPSGNYEVRYMLNNSFTEPSPPARASFTVTGGGGGGGGAAPFCGDTICNNGETSATCPGDCGGGGGGGGGGISSPPPPALFFGASPSVLSAGESVTLSWSASNVTSCSAGGDASWTGSKPTAGSATFVNMPQGTKTYTLTCQTASGSPISSSAQIFVGPAPIPVVFFSATPSVLAAGGNVTLSWSSTHSVSCTGSGDAAWSGQNPKPTSGTITFTDVETSTTYSILCTNSTGQSSPVQNVKIVVGPTLSFTASPASVDYGAKTLLAWTASPNVTSCTPTGFTAPITLPTGSVLVLPPKSTPYTLTCKTADASVLPVTKSASVAVKPVFLKFDVNPESVNTAGTATFAWQASSNAVSCDVAGDWKASNLPISGSKVFSGLTVTQKFTLSCATSDNLLVVQPAKITVIPVPVITLFTANKTSINANEPITVKWSVINATKCTIGNVPEGFINVAFSDGTHTETISNLTESTTLSLVCANDSGGAATKQVPITVNNIPPPSIPTLTFAANKTTINSGDSVVVTWTVKDATKCAATGPTGWTGLVNSTDGTHTQTVTKIQSSDTLGIICYGVSENVTKTIPITVNSVQSFLCQGVGKCKSSADVCQGTKKLASDCAGGTLCCVVSGGGALPSLGQWITSPAQGGAGGGSGLLISLVGGTVAGWLITPDGVGWQMTPSGSTSFAPVKNSAGNLQIVPNGNGSWQVLPSSGGGVTSLSNVEFTPDGSGGFKIVPIVDSAPSGGSAGLGGGSCTGGTCMPGSCSTGTHSEGTCTSGTTCCMPDTSSSGGAALGPGEGSGLVPCGTGDVAGGDVDAAKKAAENCQFEHLIVLAKNLINFLLFTIAVPIAAISFAWAGWLYMSAAGNESKVQEAHKIFGYVVWGLCIALAAWLIVNAIVIGLGVGSEYNFLGP